MEELVQLTVLLPSGRTVDFHQIDENTAWRVYRKFMSPLPWHIVTFVNSLGDHVAIDLRGVSAVEIKERIYPKEQAK